MNRSQYLGYRVLWGGVASFIVTVVLFALALSLGDLTQSPEAQATFGEPDQFWHPDDPFYAQYVDWITSLATFDWGTSQRFGEPVTAVLAERAPITAAYLIPAVLLGTLTSTVFGYVAAVKQGKWSDSCIRAVSYIVLAAPNFVVGALILRYFEARAYELNVQFYELDASFMSGWNLFWLLVATLLLGTHVAAVQMQQVRTQSAEYLDTDLTQMLRAKGVGRVRFARHVLRAAAVPITSLFVAEVLGLLLVSIFVVEAVLGVPGLGQVTWQAISINDGPLVLTITFLISFTIILATILEDVVAVVFDPRLDAEH